LDGPTGPQGSQGPGLSCNCTPIMDKRFILSATVPPITDSVRYTLSGDCFSVSGQVGGLNDNADRLDEFINTPTLEVQVDITELPLESGEISCLFGFWFCCARPRGAGAGTGVSNMGPIVYARVEDATLILGLRNNWFSELNSQFYILDPISFHISAQAPPPPPPTP
jgi:hypothetical protein